MSAKDKLPEYVLFFKGDMDVFTCDEPSMIVTRAKQILNEKHLDHAWLASIDSLKFVERNVK